MKWHNLYRNMTVILLRLSFAGALVLLVLLLSTLVNLVEHLDDIAPAEFRLLLQVMKNRFLR